MRMPGKKLVPVLKLYITCDKACRSLFDSPKFTELFAFVMFRK